jgi:lysozyme
MKVRCLAALAVPLALAGCSSTVTHTVTELTPAPVVTYIPPESSVTPEGAKPVAPPVSLKPTVTHELTIDSTGLRLIEGFEGYSRCAYWDPYGHVYTAGFGQTKRIYAGFCFASRAAAEQNLKRSVQAEYEWAVHAIGYPFDQHEVDALDSFAYNVGAGVFVGALRADLASGHIYAASRIMLQYDHAGGIVLAGLRLRREIEVRLLLAPEPKPKPSRAALLREREALRVDLTRHRCRIAPYHGRGRYHAICHRWLSEGQSVDRQLKGTK